MAFETLLFNFNGYQIKKTYWGNVLAKYGPTLMQKLIVHCHEIDRYAEKTC